MNKPTVAVVLGDPAGIGPELCGKLLSQRSNRDKARFIVVADAEEFAQGLRVAGASLEYEVTETRPTMATAEVLVWDYRGRGVAPFTRAEASENGGVYCIDTLKAAIDLTTSGITEAVFFAPLNKSSLHQAGLPHEDECQWFAHLLDADQIPHGELNYLDGLWTTRVTSHVALKDVPELITNKRILGAIQLAYTTLVNLGVQQPRIAVCGLNPHNGENGNFGREEIETISPAIAEARGLGLPVEGPFPADTIFLRAKDYNAIVTMYHDQGQIAMKLMGFSRGVTIHGGLPIPIATPAHGTAFDIQGKGVANTGAAQAALDISVRLALGRRQPA